MLSVKIPVHFSWKSKNKVRDHCPLSHPKPSKYHVVLIFDILKYNYTMLSRSTGGFEVRSVEKTRSRRKNSIGSSTIIGWLIHALSYINSRHVCPHLTVVRARFMAHECPFFTPPFDQFHLRHLRDFSSICSVLGNSPVTFGNWWERLSARVWPEAAEGLMTLTRRW